MRIISTLYTSLVAFGTPLIVLTIGRFLLPIDSSLSKHKSAGVNQTITTVTVCGRSHCDNKKNRLLLAGPFAVISSGPGGFSIPAASVAQEQQHVAMSHVQHENQQNLAASPPGSESSTSGSRSFLSDIQDTRDAILGDASLGVPPVPLTGVLRDSRQGSSDASSGSDTVSSGSLPNIASMSNAELIAAETALSNKKETLEQEYIIAKTLKRSMEEKVSIYDSEQKTYARQLKQRDRFLKAIGHNEKHPKYKEVKSDRDVLKEAVDNASKYVTKAQIVRYKQKKKQAVFSKKHAQTAEQLNKVRSALNHEAGPSSDTSSSNSGDASA